MKASNVVIREKSNYSEITDLRESSRDGFYQRIDNYLLKGLKARHLAVQRRFKSCSAITITMVSLMRL
jgi:uncharacterized protein YeeX (DUF496 family)